MDTDLMGFAELSRSIGARHYSFSRNTGFSSVVIDSRAAKEGSLFFALVGASCDGHSFVTAAFDSGARGAVVESSKLEGFDLVNAAQKTEKELIVVENTLKGLQDSARVYLEKFPGLVKIGITGSSGKSTTKEIAAAIISCEKNTVMNKGNLNSETGLPLSVFEVRPCHEVGVFELGMNRKGEISELAEILKPNIALITNIGSAHIEYFGSKLEILKEKRCIYNFLSDNDVALIPKDDEYSGILADGVTGIVRYYGAELFDEFEGTRSLGIEGTEVFWAGEKINFPLPGRHSFEDAIAAVAIAKEVSVSNNAIKRGLESVKPLFGRLEILKGRTTVVMDCYNANPESMARSVEFCDSLEWSGRKVYVIGDMLELGDNSFAEHEKLGELLSRCGAEMVFLFGGEITSAGAKMAEKGRRFYHSKDIDELSSAIDSFLREGDLVLLKGSRGCALERLSEMLTGEARYVS
ncbi:MAG: UDP-N-acetylmuramoyl-tripeptide--D-alanyl-D-alanine ligase [Treponema sp.]|jgi:UDP-N-acetylmuramoyl-tripeptide--D-alanyl-D-alanine ligase|nr:UDP-N-acetylmuramoyl-tripeptide--D-alanyl-D-alanine ligase [Treponema sp.]